MEDEVQPDDCPSTADIKSIVDNLSALRSHDSDSEILRETKKKTKEWQQAASRKFLVAVQSLHKLVGNRNEKIRQELAHFATCLLRTCSV